MRVKCNLSDDNNKNNNIFDNNKDKLYIGSTGVHFKDIYTGHRYNFKHINKKNSTRLSDFVWQCFERYGTKSEMEWSRGVAWGVAPPQMHNLKIL